MEFTQVKVTVKPEECPLTMDQLKYGQMATIVGGRYDGTVVLRTIDDTSVILYSTATRTGDMFNRECTLPVKLLVKGDSVTIEVL